MTQEIDDNGSLVAQGVRGAQIYASTKYPIVSAYEFEFLKEEEIIRQRLSNCTIYIIVQRALTYFDNVVLKDGIISFEMTDGVKEPLRCRVSLVQNEICAEDEVVDIHVHFFSRIPGVEQPFQNVGALKVYRTDGSFALWWSPQKFLYEVLVNGLRADIEGDPYSLLDFHVHYIGKAFSQRVWSRLTGHEKMQQILTLEGPIGAAPEVRAPFEISLIMLDIVGLDDIPQLPDIGLMDQDGIETIGHIVDMNDDDAVGKFLTESPVKLGDEALTIETEAFLIKNFRPKYNKTMFNKYPNISGGMRSKGYTWTNLIIERLPAKLSTEFASAEPISE